MKKEITQIFVYFLRILRRKMSLIRPVKMMVVKTQPHDHIYSRCWQSVPRMAKVVCKPHDTNICKNSEFNYIRWSKNAKYLSQKCSVLKYFIFVKMSKLGSIALALVEKPDPTEQY